MILHRRRILKQDVQVVPSAQLAHDFLQRSIVEVEIAVHPGCVAAGVDLGHADGAVVADLSILVGMERDGCVMAGDEHTAFDECDVGRAVGCVSSLPERTMKGRAESLATLK